MTPLIPPEHGHHEKTVGIIGGEGRFGRWMAKFFEERGFVVLVADLGTSLTAEDLVERARTVIVSVPIGVTAEALARIGPRLSPSHLVVDLTSVKTPLLEVYRTISSEILSIHPMFAPSAPTMQAQRVVVCRLREGERSRAFETLLTDAGALLTALDPERHDRLMAFVQGLHHLSSIALGVAVARSGFSVEELLEVTSPIYRMRMAMVGRILGHDPRLYAEISTENPFVPEAVDLFARCVGELTEAVARDDVDGFVSRFEEARDRFRSYQSTADEESALLVETLVKRSS